MSFFLGAFGAVMAMGLVYLGFMLGIEYGRPKAEVEQPKDDELRRFKADQKAFEQLMGYNADVAYGNKVFPGGDYE